MPDLQPVPADLALPRRRFRTAEDRMSYKPTLHPPWTEFVSVKIWTNILENGERVKGFINPIADVRAYWHTGKRDGQKYLHLHHVGLGNIDAKSEVITASGETFVITQVTKIHGEWIASVVKA